LHNNGTKDINTQNSTFYAKALGLIRELVGLVVQLRKPFSFRFCGQPFKSCVCHNYGADFKRIKSYNSQATIATELFKLSTDSASLLISIKKTLFDLGGGFSLGDGAKRQDFESLTHFYWPWALTQSAIFMDQNCVEIT